MNNITTHAQLWVGNPATIAETAIHHLQQQLCAQKGCNTCVTCKQLANKQHHQLLWLEPEKPYTLEDLELLFETATFARDQHEPFFFVLAHAELLNNACANQLLKIIEEPPTGYYFILLTHRPNAVIKTIRSRCMLISHETNGSDTQHPLYQFFTQTGTKDALVFMQLLDGNPISEHESLELIDRLLAHYYQKILENTMGASQQKIELLQAALLQPPMPGSSKLFWRNIVMRWPRED